MSTLSVAYSILGGVILVGLLLILSYLSGFDRAALNSRTEAVERGFAEWVPDKQGNTTFKWKEVAE